MTDDAAFVHALAAAVPPLRGLLAQHLADYEELLPHVFMGDASRFVIGQYNEHREGSPGSLAVLEPLFSTLERGAAEGSEDVQEMITVSFLENVAEEMTLFPDLQSFLGPTLKHELRRVLDGFGYPSPSLRVQLARRRVGSDDHRAELRRASPLPHRQRPRTRHARNLIVERDAAANGGMRRGPAPCGVGPRIPFVVPITGPFRSRSDPARRQSAEDRGR